MIEETKGKTVKVLSIGNSFSVNAQTYLYDIAKADGTDMVIANLYIGGCSLERHWDNAQKDNKAYRYFKTHMDDKEASIKDALMEEDWDYITFQQNSGNSGMLKTYFPYLIDLVKYVKEFAPSAQHIMHQT